MPLSIVFCFGIFFLCFYSFLAAKKYSQKTISKPLITSSNEEDPYVILSNYIGKTSKHKDIQDFSFDEIRRAISVLSTATSTWKTMDGATHQLRNTFKESSSLTNRYLKFIQKKSRNTKEANKIYEYIDTVERGLQACELLQIHQMKKRIDFFRKIGLSELIGYQCSFHKIQVHVSLLNMTQEMFTQYNSTLNNTKASHPFATLKPNELILLIDDSLPEENDEINNLLHILSQETPTNISLLTQPTNNNNPNNNKNQTTTLVQPTLYDLSLNIYQQLSEYLNVSYPMLFDNNQTNQTTLIQPTKIRIIGRSSGGAIATYLSYMFDGLISFPKDSLERQISNHFHHSVKCITLGCPPCVSRSLVPKFITSIICGDDMIPRANHKSLETFRNRVTKALKSGAGKKGMSWLATPTLIADMTSVAGKSLKRYKVRKQDSKGLGLPGRVFFIKSRMLKQGATMQRVLRGNWQEDILWNIQEILISSKMLEHHSLPAYIRTLNRC